MITFIKDILKGAVIGVANIIPGVSGGTMAVSLGIYDSLIHCITHFVKEFKKSIRFLIPILLGVVLGIGVLSFLITYMFATIPVQTNFLFIGLIIGGLPMIFGKLKATGEKINTFHFFALLAFFAVVIIFATIQPGIVPATALTFSAGNAFKLLAVGIIASATMVIPGVSGSMVMMLLGYYESIIAGLKTFIEALLSFDMAGILAGLGFIIPFGIGVLIGIAGIAKLIELVFMKAPNYAYCAIIGLILASPIAIIIMSDASKYNIVSVLTGLLAAAIGVVAARKLGKE